LNLFPKAGRGLLLAVIFWGFLACVEGSWAQPMAGGGVTNEIRIVELQGTAEVAAATATTWMPVRTNQILRPFDRLRTGANSRMALLWSDRSVVSFGALTELEILPPDSAGAQCGLHLFRGIVSFFHRDEPGRIRVITRGAVAGVEGTEFVLAVAPGKDTELTTMSVIDGKVRFGNEQATLLLTNGQQAVVELGQAPVRTAGFIANNVLQWCFYYPAVIDPADLPFTPEEQKILVESLQAYRSGDLQVALAKYPAGRQPGSDAERVYYAGLLLGVGQVEPAETVLASLSAADASSRPQRIALALRQLISAVKRQPNPAVVRPQLATEFLANSYYEQSRAIPGISLPAALDSARQAVTNSPKFGFGWERVAELEFSFGHTSRALDALDKSLALAPRNAQALALKGFLLAAQNRTGEAIGWFDQALAVDSALGNAWLGRGLCRIRRGDAAGGREDLLVAAALEPQRAGLRSYLGKAYATAGDYAHAARELQLAKKLDPNDPTAWLYSALLNQENNRINDAIRDLEKSQSLNDNQSVYRSQLLLDQDRAVRSANLAGIYRDAGMDDVAVREASRAVNYDYANYSAHLFLANSYYGLSDPNLINLRYETPTENEYLLANLLAPVSAGTLSPTISQQEYSPLFERDRLGVVSSTEYLSRGAWTQSGAQFGTFENFSYDVEGFYRSDPGQQVNNDSEQRQLSAALKYQFTPQDTVYLQVNQYEANSGDLNQYYNPTNATRGFRMNEDQTPIVSLGYHHEWSPGVHTLFFAARLDDKTSFTNSTQPSFFEGYGAATNLDAAENITMREHFTDRLDIYSGELQQIWEGPVHNTIIGTRIQYGHFNTTVLQDNPSPYVAPLFPDPPTPAAQQDITSLFKRISFYGYHQWQIFEPLQLIGGVTYDHITYPENFRSAPISGNETTAAQVSPKAGLIWTPLDNTTVRFAYTRSLAGASLDQSYQIEPSQVAGFIQNYRSIIPESIAGDNAGAKFETYDLSLEQKFRTGTYLGISGEILNSTVNRVDGAFQYYPYSTNPDLQYPIPGGQRENLDYQEKSLLVTVNQLLGREWSLGVRYLLSQAVLNDNFPDVPGNLPPLPSPSNNQTINPKQRTEGVLQQLNLSAIYNHPCGFFAKGEALWDSQFNEGYTPGEPGADFWQFNAFLGYRFPRRKAEIMLGLLNITGQNYNLNPLNLYNELPRSRTLVLRLQMNF
jgi:tetratricopeptide (TPR) repeat protein/outer membrane receptor protein involved in Fe transport